MSPLARFKQPSAARRGALQEATRRLLGKAEPRLSRVRLLMKRGNDNHVFMIVGADHVQITVPKKDEAAPQEFDPGILSLPKITKPANRLANGGCWLRLRSVELHVGVEDDTIMLAQRRR